MTIAPSRHVRPSLPASRSRPGRSRRPGRRSLGSKLIGGLGEILITVGVLGLLFVVWELWWTGIEAESDREEALDEFYVAMPDSAAEAGAQASGAVDGEPAAADPHDFETCYTLDDGTEIGCAPTMAEQAAAGEVMGTLYAPRLGSDWAAPVREGVSAEQIDRGGVGRYPHTQMPDEPGNFAVAGHRNTHANMLGRQDDLQTGDRLYLVSADGMYTYEVTQRHVVNPDQTEVLAPVPHEPGAEAETGTLTLTTCHPMYSNAQRLIHHAQLVDFTALGGEAAEEISHHAPITEMFYAGGAS